MWIDNYIAGVKVHGGMAAGFHPAFTFHEHVEQSQAFGIRQDSSKQCSIGRFQSPGCGKLGREKQCAGKSHYS
jgi:hypothetical protein